MRARVIGLVTALFLLVLSVPAAFAADGGSSLKGTLRGPGGTPVAGVSIAVASAGSVVGKATTDATGAWQVPVPAAGTYSVDLDTATLPATVHLRTKGGESLRGVSVQADEVRTLIFPLVASSTPQEEPKGATPTPSASGSSGPVTEGGTGDPPAAGASSTPAPDLAGKSLGGQVVQLVVEGIKFGAIIAITAVGLSLVFGTTGLINFAHGELVTIGAVTAFLLSSGPGHLPLIVAAVFAVLAGAVFGGAMETVLWRPLRGRGAGLIQMFIVSIGVSLLLRHIILIVFGSRRQPYDQFTVQKALEIGPVAITPRDLVVTVLSVLVLLGVAFMLQRTRVGKATRAVADNRALAESSGINVNRVILVVWLVGGGLAGLGGVFFGLIQQAVFWDMGFNLLLLMFAGVILGGLGSAYGAVLGSFVVALVAQLSTLWFPLDLQYAWALLALIVVLLVRPQGILGRAERAG